METKAVVFRIGRSYYAADIGQVREIHVMKDITPVPQAPPSIEGIINLRGDVLPIMDLRTRLGLPRIEPTADSRIIEIQADEQRIGLIVDSVSEVAGLPGELLEPPTCLTSDSGGMEALLLGVANIGGHLVLVMDPVHLLDFQLHFNVEQWLNDCSEADPALADLAAPSA